MMIRNNILLASLVTACFAIGCHTDHEPRREVVVEHGYYYDAEYYDADHHFHPRQFYYYDGHQYVAHDAPPADVVIHERAAHGDIHGGHPDGHTGEHPGDLHAGDQAPPGADLHGDGLNHDDRGGQLGPRDR